MKKSIFLSTVVLGVSYLSSTWAIMAPQYDIFDTREQLEKSGQLGVCSVVTDGCSERNVVDGNIGDPIKLCKVTTDFKFQRTCMTGNPNIMYMTGTPIVGGDSDEHGCKGSAGYSWDSVADKCLRPWEENTSSFSSSDITNYDSVKTALSESLRSKVDVALSNYKEKLSKLSYEERKTMNGKIILKVEKIISDYFLRLPQDKALNGNDLKKYRILTYLKYKLSILQNNF